MERNQRAEGPPVCPECGAAFSGEGTYCWLCGWKPGDPVGIRPKGPPTVNPYASPALKPGDLKWTFSLSTLFLWTALVAVVLGVYRIAPGLGITLGIFSLIAALHTTGIAAYRKKRLGRALTVQEKILAFLGSFAVVLLIAVAVVAAIISALFVICMSGGGIGQLGPSPGFAIPAIAITAIAIAVGFGVFFIVRRLWRTPKD